MRRFIDAEACAACGGRCCKHLPGALLPSDVKPSVSVESLIALLSTRYYAVDWWEGDPREGMYELERAYFIRPHTQVGYANGCVYDASWGGACIFLRDSGCELSHDERLYECRALEPRYPNACVRHACQVGNGRFTGKLAAALAWLPYYDMIEEAAARL